MDRIELEIDISIDEAAAKERGLSVEDIMNGIRVCDDDTCDGAYITTDIPGCDCTRDFFLRAADLVSVKRKDPQAEKDRELERLWEELSDIPFDENESGELILAAPWHGFPAHTEREEIWHWFDEGHSKGVAYLLYGTKPAEAKTAAKNAASLVALENRCFECMAEQCAFNPHGICRFPMVYGVLPEMTEEDGCLDMLLARDAFEE